MEWRNEAIVLSSRRHGEAGAIAHVLTREQGRFAGLVHGGGGRKSTPVLQPGNRVQATWRARLENQLGVLTCELISADFARLLNDPLRLAALASACALTDAALPERAPFPAIHDGLSKLIAGLDADAWAADYIRWEAELLADLGFGLDLTECAATGANDRLAYVSPRTGRAVSLSAGEPYRDRLLTLPRFLLPEPSAGEGPAAPTAADLAAGLNLTGHFLERHVFAAVDLPMPPARTRLADRLAATKQAPPPSGIRRGG